MIGRSVVDVVDSVVVTRRDVDAVAILVGALDVLGGAIVDVDVCPTGVGGDGACVVVVVLRVRAC
jgi:hypothetical protein